MNFKADNYFFIFLLLYISCDESSEVGLELEDQDNSLEAKYRHTTNRIKYLSR